MSTITEKVSKFYVMSIEMPFDDANRFADIANKCGQITAIWCLRRMYPISLMEAKEFIESLMVDK